MICLDRRGHGEPCGLAWACVACVCVCWGTSPSIYVQLHINSCSWEGANGTSANTCAERTKNYLNWYRVNSTRPLHHAWGRLSKTKHACMIFEQNPTCIAMHFRVLCVLPCFGQVPYGSSCWAAPLICQVRSPHRCNVVCMHCILHSCFLIIAFMYSWCSNVGSMHAWSRICM